MSCSFASVFRILLPRETPPQGYTTTAMFHRRDGVIQIKYSSFLHLGVRHDDHLYSSVGPKFVHPWKFVSTIFPERLCGPNILDIRIHLYRCSR